MKSECKSILDANMQHWVLQVAKCSNFSVKMFIFMKYTVKNVCSHVQHGAKQG